VLDILLPKPTTADYLNLLFYCCWFEENLNNYKKTSKFRDNLKVHEHMLLLYFL